MFMSFDAFKGSLGSWQEPLKTFLDSKTFQDIYKYVKTEYESGKKVINVFYTVLPTTRHDLQRIQDYTGAKSESSYSWPRSLPSTKTSSWIMLQCNETCTTTSITQEYLQKFRIWWEIKFQETQSWWFNKMGITRRILIECITDSLRQQTKLTFKMWMAKIHRWSHQRNK